jgi:hypothetical protein
MFTAMGSDGPRPAPRGTTGRDALASAAAVAAGHIPFHGAAIARGDQVMVLTGQSGSGKSTLAAAATLSGWGYVADEVAPVDPATRAVSAYHRPIGLRRQGAEALGLPFPANRTVPGDAVDWPVPVERHSAGGTLHTLVLARWDHDDDALDTVTVLDPAQAMVELLQHLVVEDAHITACFSGIEQLVHHVPVARLIYTSPAAGVAALDALLM